MIAQRMDWCWCHEIATASALPNVTPCLATSPACFIDGVYQRLRRVNPKPAPKRKIMGLYAFRLPDKLIADVDRYARQLEAERPGIRVTRAEALRVLLLRALKETGTTR